MIRSKPKYSLVIKDVASQYVDSKLNGAIGANASFKALAELPQAETTTKHKASVL